MKTIFMAFTINTGFVGAVHNCVSPVTYEEDADPDIEFTNKQEAINKVIDELVYNAIEVMPYEITEAEMEKLSDVYWGDEESLYTVLKEIDDELAEEEEAC